MTLLPLRLFGVFVPDLQKLPSLILRTFPNFSFLVAASSRKPYISLSFFRKLGEYTLASVGLLPRDIFVAKRL